MTTNNSKENAELGLEIRRALDRVSGTGDRLDTIRAIAQSLEHDDDTMRWLHDNARFGSAADHTFENLLLPAMQEWRKEHHVEDDSSFDNLSCDRGLWNLLHHAVRQFNPN